MFIIWPCLKRTGNKQIQEFDWLKSTKSDLNAWKKFCESLKESRTIENILANELDFLSKSPFVNKMALSTGRVQRRVCCSQTR